MTTLLRSALASTALALTTLPSSMAFAQDAAGSQPYLRPYAPGTPPRGLGATDTRPGYALVPADTDWSWLDDYDGPTDFYDRFKRIPLDPSGTVRLSLSALSYVEYEGYDDAAFGLVPGYDDYMNTRLNVYGDLEFGERVRLFGALKHGDRTGADVTPSPTERDSIDFHQGFVQLGLGDAFGLPVGDVFVRAGRQELDYGGGRMITVREGPNVRNDFDGVIVRARIGRSVTDVFAAYEVSDERDAFDNETLDDRGVWGVYSSFALPGQVLGKGQALDLYYFGNRRRDSPYVQALLDETRHSLGVRWTSAGGVAGPGFSWDLEATGQFGSATNVGPGGPIVDDVSGYSLTGSVGYGWNAAWSPFLNVAAGVTSGDDDPTDDRVTTFRAPYPPGRYFGDTTPFGPSNILGASAALSLQPTERLTVTPGALVFFRLEENDGLYTPGGTVIRGANGDDHYVGWEANFLANYRFDRHWTGELEVGQFFGAGDNFLADNPPARNVTRVKAKLALQF